MLLTSLTVPQPAFGNTTPGLESRESVSVCANGQAESSELQSRSEALERTESLEWEEWDRRTPFWQHAVAGSCAGVMEHVAMYPIDMVKTRMQAAPVKSGHTAPGALQVVREVLREQGASGLMRGCFAIGAGCIPAHIGLFCTYEYAKGKLMDLEHK